MEISRELLEKRVEDVIAQKEQFIARANACEGALVAFRDLLGDLDREDEEKEDGGPEEVGPPTEE